MTTLSIIEFSWLDPWTGDFCAGSRLPWTRQLAAEAFYSRHIRKLKPIAAAWCWPRKPVLRITYYEDQK